MKAGIVCAGEVRGILLAECMGLRWGWLNLFNMMFVVLLLLPNLVYTWKRRGEKNLCRNRLMNGMEQIGRYGSMLFMLVCFKEGGFGFPSLFDFFCYGFGSFILLSGYWIGWILYFWRTGVHIFVRSEGPTAVFVAGKSQVKRVTALKWALALLPSALFLLCGITLRYIPLVLSALLFTAGHSYVTHTNIRQAGNAY